MTEILFSGEDLYRGYFDPDGRTLEIVSSRDAESGVAWSPANDFLIGVDDEQFFSHAQLAIGAPFEHDVPTPPEGCPVARIAETELVDDGAMAWHFDVASGVLTCIFEGAKREIWGRIGPNLLWLALDSEANLAALVLKGVARDPGGAAQAAWLANVERA